MDFETKITTKDREEHYIFIGKIYQKDLNIYGLSTRKPKFIKETLLQQLKPHIDPHRVIVHTFNTPPSPQTSRRKLDKETMELNNVINQLYPINIYRTSHPHTKKILPSQQSMELSQKLITY